MQIIYVYRLQGLFDVLPVLARSNACQAIVENLSDTKRTNFSYQANASCKTQVRNLCFRNNTNSFNSCSSDSKTRWQNTQLFAWHIPFCSKSLLYSWRTSYLLWPNYISRQCLLLLHSSASLYPALYRFLNCLYHCYLCRSLQTWLISTINSLSLNYPVSSRSKTLLLVLSLKLLCPAISFPSYAFSTGSESMNASNTCSSLLLTKFSQLPNLHIPS